MLQKELYIYSNIFEKLEDIRYNPFKFKKTTIKDRNLFSDAQMKSSLIKPKKNSRLHFQNLKLDDLTHEMDTIDVQVKNSPV